MSPRRKGTFVVCSLQIKPQLAQRSLLNLYQFNTGFISLTLETRCDRGGFWQYHRVSSSPILPLCPHCSLVFLDTHLLMQDPSMPLTLRESPHQFAASQFHREMRRDFFTVGLNLRPAKTVNGSAQPLLGSEDTPEARRIELSLAPECEGEAFVCICSFT